MAQEILSTPRPAVRPRARRLGRRIGLGLLALLGLAVLLVAVGALWVRAEVRASLPQLDGRRTLAGLAAPVRIERDAQGVPVVRGRNRLDIARATGFLHAQERFFQMDLSRRQAAGELAELFGPAAVRIDKRHRIHRFRARAARLAARLPAGDRALLAAYAAGVNAGLAALGATPFEYLATRTRPAPWRPEDSVLVAFAMCFELQDEDGGLGSALGVLYAPLPPALADFLAPRGGGWEAPLLGESFQAPAVPGPEVFDLRKLQHLPRAAALARPRRPAETADAGDAGD